MKKFFYTLSLSIVLFGLWSFKPQTDPVKKSIKWLSMQEAIQLSKKNPDKKIFVDVYTDWCGWCKVMDKKTFTDPEVIEYINKHYYAVKLNAEQKEDIAFKGRTYEYIHKYRGGYHELAATLLQGKLSFPTVVFLDENLGMIQPIPGFQKPNTLIPMLKYIGEDHYKKNVTWKEFLKM